MLRRKNDVLHLKKREERNALIENWVYCWNENNIAACSFLMSNDVELEANCILDIITESNGVLKTNKTVCNFFEILQRLFPNRKYQLVNVIDLEDKAMVHLLNLDDNNTHLASFSLNCNGKISKIHFCDC